MNDLLRDALNKRLDKKQSIFMPIPALVGNDAHVINVPNRANYIYVRISGVTTQIYNKKAVSLDMSVWVGKTPSEPNFLQVLGEIPSRPRYNEDNVTTYRNPPHRESHTYPNDDWTPIQSRQIMPLRVTAIGGMVVRIYKNIVKTVDGFDLFDTQTFDLSGYRSLENYGVYAKYILLEISGSGIINVVDGVDISFADLDYSDIPSPTSGAQAIAAVRIWSGQLELVETKIWSDIKDLRFSGSNGGTADQKQNSRVLGNDVTIADTENLIVSEYFDLADYALTLEGDAVLEII